MRHEPDANDFGAATVRGPLFDQSPFDRSQMDPTNEERRVADLIWRHRGRNNPITIAQITEATSLEAREIKAIVAELVVSHKMRIGGRREAPVGYFVIEDAADLEAAVKPFKGQILAMWKRLRVLEDPQELAKLRGQLTLED